MKPQDLENLTQEMLSPAFYHELWKAQGDVVSTALADGVRDAIVESLPDFRARFIAKHPETVPLNYLPAACLDVAAKYKDAPPLYGMLIRMPQVKDRVAFNSGCYIDQADVIALSPSLNDFLSNAAANLPAAERSRHGRLSNDQQVARTLFHEMIHSTGAAHRLGRSTMMVEVIGRRIGYDRKGRDANRSLEEVIAEWGAMILMSRTPLYSTEVAEFQRAYAQAHLTSVADGYYLQVPLMEEAQKAANYIAGRESVRLAA